MRLRIIVPLTLMCLLLSSLTVNAVGADDWWNRTEVRLNLADSQAPGFSLETVQPFLLNEDGQRALFWQGRVASQTDSGMTTNLGLGYRWLSQGGRRLAGLNSFYDRAYEHDHSRWGLGAEYFQGQLEFRANGYFAISGAQETAHTPTIATYERAVDGYDYELGTTIPGAPWFSVYAQGFHYDYDYFDDAEGYRLRTALQLTPHLQVDAGYRHDTLADEEHFANVRYTFGAVNRPALWGSEGAVALEPADLGKKLLQRVERENDIRVETYQKALPIPDLTIDCSHAGDFTQGQTGTYTLLVSNVGTKATDGSTVTVADLLPEGLTATGMAGDGWEVDLDTLTATRSDVLAPEESYAPLALTVTVKEDAVASLTNTVTVSGGGDLNPTNNTDRDQTKVILTDPDLAITCTHSGSFGQGQGGTYVLTVTNVGTAPTEGTITVTDVLPAGLTPVNLSGDGWSVDLNTLTATRTAPVEQGASTVLTLTVTAAEDAPAQLTNTTSVSCEGDLNPTNDTATDVTDIVPLVRFHVTVVDIAGGTVPGATVSVAGTAALTILTDAMGQASFRLPPGDYWMHASKAGYNEWSNYGGSHTGGRTYNVTLHLISQDASAAITVFEPGDSNRRVAGATVSVLVDGETRICQTDYFGGVAFNDLPPGDYIFTAVKSGYGAGTTTLTVSGGALATGEIHLTNQT